MIPVKGGYAVDVPTINVSDRARREHATIWSTFRAFHGTHTQLQDAGPCNSFGLPIAPFGGAWFMAR